VRPSPGTRIWSYRDKPIIHLAVGVLVCLFVLSPALFTPWGFGPDFTNHLWLVWQQSLAISKHGHPTLYLQQPGGILQPFYGFYGGTLYAIVGSLGALVGTNHIYSVYVATYGISAAAAYGGMWWLGRLLGLSRWAAHLPAFVVVTAAYYLTDAYARGAWPEFVALSAVPLFLAGASSLLSKPWRAGTVTAFLAATVVLTGSHNITLLWSVLVIGPIAVAVWLVAGKDRPTIRRVVAVLGLALLGTGVNAWFLILDLSHAGDTQAWIQNKVLVEHFDTFFYFDNLGVVLDPLRQTPSPSSTFGLVIAAPVAAFVLSLALAGLSWGAARRAGRLMRALWLILLVAMALLVLLLVMPADWWTRLGAVITGIQFPYRLSGWLMIAVAIQLAVSLGFARGVVGRRRQVAVGLSVAFVALTIVQASAQLYSGARLDGNTNGDVHPRVAAFAGGPTSPPETYYDQFSYADSSSPVVETGPGRSVSMPVPAPGGTRSEIRLVLGKSRSPIATNIAAGPYAVQVSGMKDVGRTPGGSVVVAPEGDRREAVLVARADVGGIGTLGAVISILCLIGAFAAIGTPAICRKLKNRSGRKA
jgi:hypothetical protein